MKIAIFGSGYVGLVTAACLADVGHKVVCVDIDNRKVEALRKGVIPIFEPGLSEMIVRNSEQGRISFTTDALNAIDGAHIIFIAVGTPSDEDGSADLRHVLAVAATIGYHIADYAIVVDKSTVPVGTADKVRETISSRLAARNVQVDFDVCSNPEFLKEGSAIEDFTRAARIVVGTNSERVRDAMRECYAPYNRNHDKLMFMGIREAEFTKYAANAMLATKISFMNEMANLAERLEVDIEQVRRGIGSDPRIGYHFIYPGAGYGGSCFPKDVRALIHMGRSVDHEPHLLASVEVVNANQQRVLFQKLSAAFDGNLAGRTIALWGLAFKPNTDDMREAPSRPLMEALWVQGARVQAFDPEAMHEVRHIYGERDDLKLFDDPLSAVEGADALAICTEWKQFRVVDFAWLKRTLAYPIVVDGRNLYEPADVSRHGLLYFAVGRGASLKGKPGAKSKVKSATEA
ncbi:MULTISPECIES: UDP-glucose/GDP-mannose dehydrogenase family protein [unclassified Beijerinckia]|uniref:UDP-glucose dehydrogenase family protein n=1 Tax=unclassified Beijerinckia TaxID=2638183 RepID=UPI000898BD1A|nr:MULTISPECIES: UDP-glucose/GDP-mannose dehydrogenase family protein [unclassified Beijerinckia]MDH7797005.1 UDPglucose 6-dehydrogenase [Beijerinckia sp. GAS462]SEC68323.1 UDPglucose 6-dehydrogenase [Beijerinckia sp. 28-YEA-48]